MNLPTKCRLHHHDTAANEVEWPTHPFPDSPNRAVLTEGSLAQHLKRTLATPAPMRRQSEKSEIGS
jgi:hypothetical protein